MQTSSFSEGFAEDSSSPEISSEDVNNYIAQKLKSKNKKYFHSRQGGVITAAETHNSATEDFSKTLNDGSTATSTSSVTQSIISSSSASTFAPNTSSSSSNVSLTPLAKNKIGQSLKKQFNQIATNIQQQNQKNLNFIREASNVPKKLIQTTLLVPGALVRDNKESKHPNILLATTPKPVFASDAKSYAEQLPKNAKVLGKLYVAVMEMRITTNQINTSAGTAAGLLLAGLHNPGNSIVNDTEYPYAFAEVIFESSVHKTRVKQKTFHNNKICFAWNENMTFLATSESEVLYVNIYQTQKQDHNAQPKWIGFAYVPVDGILAEPLMKELWQPLYTEKGSTMSKTLVRLNIQYERAQLQRPDRPVPTPKISNEDKELIDKMSDDFVASKLLRKQSVARVKELGSSILSSLNIDDSGESDAKSQAVGFPSELPKNHGSPQKQTIGAKVQQIQEEDMETVEEKSPETDTEAEQRFEGVNTKVLSLSESVENQKTEFVRFKVNEFADVENKVDVLEQQLSQLTQLVRLLNQENKTLKARVTEQEEDNTLNKQKIVALEAHVDTLKSQQSRRIMEWLYLLLAYFLRFVALLVVMASAVFYKVRSAFQKSDKSAAAPEELAIVTDLQKQIDKHRENLERLAQSRFQSIKNTPVGDDSPKLSPTSDESDKSPLPLLERPATSIQENESLFHFSASDTDDETQSISTSSINSGDLPSDDDEDFSLDLSDADEDEEALNPSKPSKLAAPRVEQPKADPVRQPAPPKPVTKLPTSQTPAPAPMAKPVNTVKPPPQQEVKQTKVVEKPAATKPPRPTPSLNLSLIEKSPKPIAGSAEQLTGASPNSDAFEAGIIQEAEQMKMLSGLLARTPRRKPSIVPSLNLKLDRDSRNDYTKEDGGQQAQLSEVTTNTESDKPFWHNVGGSYEKLKQRVRSSVSPRNHGA